MVTDGAAVGTVCWGRAEVRTEMVRKAKVMSVVRSFIVVGLVEGRRVGLGVRKVVVVGGLEKVVGRTEVEVEGLEQRWQRRYKEGYTAEGAGQESVCLGERGREEGAIYSAHRLLPGT